MLARSCSDPFVEAERFMPKLGQLSAPLIRPSARRRSSWDTLSRLMKKVGDGLGESLNTDRFLHERFHVELLAGGQGVGMGGRGHDDDRDVLHAINRPHQPQKLNSTHVRHVTSRNMATRFRRNSVSAGDRSKSTAFSGSERNKISLPRLVFRN
jgi:hypothetical protein